MENTSPNLSLRTSPFDIGSKLIAPDSFVDPLVLRNNESSFRAAIDNNDLTGTVRAGRFALASNSLSLLPVGLDLLPSSDSGALNNDNITNDSTPTFQVDALLGLVRVRLYSDGQFVGQSTASNPRQITATQQTDGTHIFTATALDILGNSLASSDPLSVTIDTALPQLNITTPLANTILTPGTRLTGTANGTGGAIASLNYRFDNLNSIPVSVNGTTGEFDASLDLTGLGSGVHTLIITTADIAGNVLTTNLQVSVDKTPPAIAATLANDTGVSNSDRLTLDPTITGTVTDQSNITSFRAGFDDTPVEEFVDIPVGIGNFTLDPTQLQTIYGGPLPDGLHTLHLQATDSSGNSSIFDVTFTFDTTAPSLTLKTPIDGWMHSSTARLIGEATDKGTGLYNIQYSLDDSTFSPVTANADGKFDRALKSDGLALGPHQVVIEAADYAGNQKQTPVDFQVTSNFNIGATGTSGWGAATTDALILAERNSLLAQTIIPVELGQTEGSRRLQFELKPQFDTTDTTSVIEDLFQVFLVNPANPNQTLLDGGSPGTALFSLAGKQAEFVPGQVRYNGSIVEIDLTSLAQQTNGLLIFRMLNSDTDTGSEVSVHSLTNTVDPEGVASPIFPANTSKAPIGPALDINGLNPSSDLKVSLSNVRLDETTGQYKASLLVRNTGTPISRTVAVVFPELPAGIELLHPSGVDSLGNPYINLYNALPPGGLDTGEISDPIEVIFNNPNLLEFPIIANVFATANSAPSFEIPSSLTVMPGGYLEVPLVATDSNGDRVTFSIQSDNPLPTGKLSGDGKLILTPTPDEVGTYNFTLIASDGGKQTSANVTLNVVPDPVTTTRISGVILSTDGQPLAGVPIELSRLTVLTDADGKFTLELPSELVPTEPFNITIPNGDPYFDPYNTGTQTINFRRARYDTSTGTSIANPRRHPNLVSGFFDGSIVYGSDEQRAIALRTLDGTGKLKTSPGNLLPFNNTTYFPDGPLQNDNSGILDPTQLFVAGDVRASENVALASLHTVLLREHNRLAEEIKLANPNLTDEEIYQQARRFVSAQLQHITYSEYLPLLLGPESLTPYSGYKLEVDPMATPFFATAAFRLGHSQMVSSLLRIDENGNSNGNLSLREAFFTTTPIVEDGIESILRGLVAQLAQDIDTKVVDELRNFLFGPSGSGGMDLPAMNIQRSRDLGLPNYTQARLDFGLTPVTSFQDITSNVAVQNALQSIYGTVDKIDPWVGGLAEDHVPGAAVGELFQAVLKNEFERLRDADRFWYENGQFTDAELAFIRNTTLADLIERNTGITNLPDNIFTTSIVPSPPSGARSAAATSPTEYRSINGSGNNLNNPDLGQTGENLRIDYSLDYGDRMDAPNGADRPGAREISNAVFAQTGDIPNTVGATAMTIFWGQMISHDISLTPTGTTNTLKIHGERASSSEKYPFIAETLPLLLEHNVYEGVDNVINRPIYLPAIDVANGKTIDPTQNVDVTTAAIPGAKVRVAAGTLQDRQGNAFTGELSITEVPVNLTPAALPENLHPDLVVTIQPGEMVFTTPAPLTLPNLSGYAPGELMDLWSINPITGFFDDVGTGRVSANGSVIETIDGGIRNSSWHFFAPPPPQPNDPNLDPRNPEDACNECKAETNFTSEVELHSGAVLEAHNLVPYQSLGVSRGLTLTYDSLRADPRPILHFGYSNVRSDSNSRLIANLNVSRGEFNYQVPGYAGGQYGLKGGEHFWSIPENGGKIDAALQLDLRSMSSGSYDYSLSSGIRLFNGETFAGSSTTSTGKLLSVNTINSSFGSGWGLAGLQELVENPDGTILLIDGDGSEVLFDAGNGNTYIAPPGDFSTLERLADNTFRRTMKDGTVYSFNAQNKLVLMKERNGNETQYVYDNTGRLLKIVDPVGLETTFSYNGDKVSSITDPANRATDLMYDASGNLTSIIDPDLKARTWEYDGEHHIIAEIDKRDRREETLYDEAGRAKQALTKDGKVLQVAPIQVQGLYDAEQTIDPFNAPVAFALGAVESNEADANGNVVVKTLDKAGQVVSSKDGAGLLPSVKRNEENLVTDSTDGRGHVTKYKYDTKGNVISISDELSGKGQIGSGDELFVPGSDYATGSNPEGVVATNLSRDSWWYLEPRDEAIEK